MINNDFHIIGLSAYQTPEIVEDPRMDFVAYGDDNLYYQDLIDAYLNSATCNSIITGVANQIYGRGISAHNASTKTEDFAKFKNLFRKKCLQKIALDLKLLGEASFQITYKNKQVETVSHFNRETLRAEKSDEKGKINAYFYHPKWKDYKDGDELTRIPVFGSGSPNEIYIIRRFIPSMHYYSPPDWSSALNYAKLESEISEYLVNEVTNSFSGTKIVNFSNGVPTIEKQHLIKNEIQNKLTGANGEKTIISFSDSPETKTTIEDISVSNASEIYTYIAEECSRKLLLANRITSPLLVGIRDAGGNSLANNKDEIEAAHNLFENVVIKPYQEMIIEAIDDILAVNGISLDLYVQTLTPIEFVNTSEVATKEKREEETGEELSKVIDFNDDDLLDQVLPLGENEKTLFDFGYQLVDERKADIDLEDELDKEIKLATAPKGKADQKSKFDGETEKGKKYLVRYEYAPQAVSKNSRKFCRAMIKANRVYRREDIDREFGGNKEFAKKGEQTYNLMKYKGGVNCKHYFIRKTYLLDADEKIDPNNPNAKKNLIYKSRVASEGIPIDKAFEKEAAKRMIDRKRGGRVN